MPDISALNLKRLYSAYAKELEGFARRRRAGDESKDVVHDAFLRMIAYAGDAAIEHPRAYLYRVTANAANDHGARARAWSERIESDVEPDAVQVPQADPESGALARNELRRCLEALEELPEVYRHVFLLNRVDGVSQGEIASALDIPRRTVERYIAKALAHCIRRVHG